MDAQAVSGLFGDRHSGSPWSGELPFEGERGVPEPPRAPEWCDQYTSISSDSDAVLLDQALQRRLHLHSVEGVVESVAHDALGVGQEQERLALQEIGRAHV